MAASAAPMIIPRHVLGGPGAPSNRLRMGSIGVGRMGRGDMEAAMGGALIVAVCDTDVTRARSAGSLVAKRQGAGNPATVYQDYRELLARDDIDGVTISTPDHQHAVVAVAAAKAGKDIYLQKPLTYSIAEGQALVKAVRQNKVILQTGSQQRSSQYFRITCELIRNGRLGKLQSIDVAVPIDQGRGVATPMPVPATLDYDAWLGPTPLAPYTQDRVHPQKGYSRPGWLQISTYCHGMITGWGAHMYDIAQWGMGTDVDSGPVEVAATADYPDRGLFNVHVGYKAEATYANGVKLTSHNGGAGVKFIGEDGWIRVHRGGFKAHDREIFRQRPGEGEVQLYKSKSHMRDFLDAMKTRKDPICPVEVGHRSNSVCVIHHIAMKMGRKLKWDPQAERFIGDDEANTMLDYPHRKGWEI
ncbi:MAG: Gfo/Idh/MocA family oxidoreductase [Verrucomicrobia bacterium]|nr:Gfo/Idh/MocA family oxidoreductase [Verrucomicrobiota bacterium]